MAIRSHFHGLELLEQSSSLESPSSDKFENQKMTSEKIKKDLNDLESKIPVAKKMVYDTQILAIRNDLDHLMEKTKWIKNTHEKTEDGGRWLGRRQERMKKRTEKNEITLNTINAKFDQLDDKVYRELGIESERQNSKQLARTMGITTDAIVNSGALKVDASGNVTGYDEAKLAAISPTLQKNIESGRAMWDGDVSTKNVVNAWAQGIIGGGMDKLWYGDKNIKNVVNIAKILAGFMIVKYYWENTKTFGEKLGWGVALYGLLSSNALGGWDMFWEGGKNGVLDVNGIINRAKGQPGSNPEVVQQKEMILKGKDRVRGIKTLFRDPQKLKEYLTKNDQGTWNFDNQKFLNNYGLDDVHGKPPVAKEGKSTVDEQPYSMGDINESAGECVIPKLILYNRKNQNTQLNDMINTYLQATDLKTPEEVINATPKDLNGKANDALAKIDKEQIEIERKKQKEALEEKKEINTWVKSVAWKDYVVVEWKEEQAKAIRDEDSSVLQKKQDLINQGIIRETTSKDAIEITPEHEKLVEDLIKIQYTPENANALVSSLIEVEKLMVGFPNQTPRLVFVGTSVFYQNHGRKIEIKSKLQDETMKFNLASLGLSDNLGLGTTGFTSGLLAADALTNIFKYIGTMDQTNKTADIAEQGKTQSQFPFKWKEGIGSYGSGLDIHSQSWLSSIANTNDQIDMTLGKAYQIGKGGLWNTQIDHTQIQSLLTTLNAATINWDEDSQSAWIKGPGITIPSVLTAVWASVEEKPSLQIEYDNIQSMGELVRNINEKGMGLGAMIWEDVVRVIEKGWGDVAERIIPAGSKVVRSAYDEVKGALNLAYTDAVDGAGQIYVDIKSWITVVYKDALKSIEVIGPDLKKGLTRTIDAAGDLTKEMIDQVISAIGNIMKPDNLKEMNKVIDGIDNLATHTLDSAIQLVAKGASDILKIPKQMYDHATRQELATGILAIRWRKGFRNAAASGMWPTPTAP